MLPRSHGLLVRHPNLEADALLHHGRIPWPRPSELDPDRRSLYERIAGGPRSSGPQLFRLTDDQGRLEGPFNGMLLAPAVGDRLQDLGTAIRYRTGLSDRCREIAILVAAAERRSDFEWYAHEAVGAHVGLTDEELETLRWGGAPRSLSHDERVIRTVVLELLRNRDLDDATFKSAASALGLDSLMELVVLVGYYDLLDLMMRTWRTPLPVGVVSPFDEPHTRGG